MVAPSDGLYVVGDLYYIHKGFLGANVYYAQVFANYISWSLTVQSAVAAQARARAGDPQPMYRHT